MAFIVECKFIDFLNKCKKIHKKVFNLSSFSFFYALFVTK